ncbi:hypothetical protein GCM10009119_27750 [Algoriphagus jejuensis]|uniref:Uncharacterized protein n=1 Tax=Algoriphagus jejuensis TaxID=419934 RepID=A0ABP3YEG9_9BACT
MYLAGPRSDVSALTSFPCDRQDSTNSTEKKDSYGYSDKELNLSGTHVNNFAFNEI